MGVPGQHLPNHPPATLVNLRGRQLGRMLENLNHMTGSRGIFATPFGVQSQPAEVVLSFLAVANGNIPPASGTDAGIGKVWGVITQAAWGGGPPTTLTAMAMTTTSQSFWVYNPSTTTMSSGNGIDSGQKCWVQQDMYGNLCVFPLECA